LFWTPDTPALNVNPVTRHRWVGLRLNRRRPDSLVFRGELSRITVRFTISGFDVPAPVIVVCPLIVIPTVTSILLVQIAAPPGRERVAGTKTVSPSLARTIAARTSACFAVAAI